jgi:hypothetical protein
MKQRASIKINVKRLAKESGVAKRLYIAKPVGNARWHILNSHVCCKSLVSRHRRHYMAWKIFRASKSASLVMENLL